MAHRKNPAANWIMLTVMLLLGVILLPMVIDQVMSANTATWNFTGYAAAKTMLGLIPFVFIVGIVVYFIGSMLRKT